MIANFIKNNSSLKNRSVKFKGWDAKNKTWTTEGIRIENGKVGSKNQDLIIVECTNILDINGKEIYEGDILRAFKETGIKWEENFYIAQWDKTGYWKLTRTDGKEWYSAGIMSDLRHIEIIGNIHTQ